MLALHTCPLEPPGTGSAGGMNVYVRKLAAELGRLGVLVDVFTRDHGCALPAVKPIAAGARLVHVKAGPRAPLHKDEVAAHVAEFACRVAAHAREARTGPYDVVHAHYWLSGQAGLHVARCWGVPLVQMFHTLGHLKTRAAAAAGERAHEARLRAEALLARSACRLVAATPAERGELVRVLRARVGRIEVVPCGVDLSLFTPGDPDAARRRLGLAGTRPVVYAGRLEPLKRVDCLITAVGRLVAAGADRGGSPLRLVVVGGDGADGDPDGEARRLTRLAVEAGLDGRVEFRGPEPHERLVDYYSAAFAVVVPSAYESFGLVALEALACGAALVATPVGAVPLVVEDGASGLVVEPRDAGELAGALGALLTDPALHARLRDGARPAVLGYGWDRVAARTAALYDSLCGDLGAEAAESLPDAARTAAPR